MSFDHLAPSVQKILEQSTQERKQFILGEKWFGYPLAQNILQELEFHLQHPKKTRMRGRLLVGATNNGKTAIIKKFIRNNPPYDADEVKVIPIIYVSAPESSNPTDLYDEIFMNMGIPFRNSDRLNKKKNKVKEIFALCQVNMLIIDEIHNILAGTISKQKAFMIALKNLSNELMIPIVLVGTAEALHATNTDSQINNRFTPLVVPKWQNNRDYLSLLSSIEVTLPLKKPSDLLQKTIADYIYDNSEGYIGEMLDLINLAAIYAIDNQLEKIDLKSLKQCGYIRPSLRRNITELIEI